MIGRSFGYNANQELRITQYFNNARQLVAGVALKCGCREGREYVRDCATYVDMYIVCK